VTERARERETGDGERAQGKAMVHTLSRAQAPDPRAQKPRRT
jgi:hypothetical protein